MDSFRTYEIVPRRDVEAQSNSNSVEKSHSVWWHVLVDVPLLACVLVVLGLYESTIIPSHKAGFFCNDPKLSYPFNGDTVTAQVLMITVILLPVVFIFATEMVLFKDEDSDRSRVSESFRRTGSLYRTYGYALFFNFIIVEFMKGIAGMPRPSFFTLCKPDTGINCTTGEYISTFECTSSQGWYVQYDSYHSFPSGHASLSVYCGLFIAWYLQRRAFSWSGRTVMVVPFLQIVCGFFTALCSLSRISDYRHHWWDVLTGAGIGVVLVLFARRDLESQSYPIIAAKTAVTEGKSHSAWWHVMIDLPLCVLVLAVVVMFGSGVIASHKPGFFCNDPSLSYPFTGDTISGMALFFTLFNLPLIFFFSTEMLLLLFGFDEYPFLIVEALRRTILLYRAYLYGFCFNFLIIEVIKNISGMPRPVFFTLCAPDTGFNCTTGEYITGFECTSRYSRWTQYDSYHSFPSGHTSLSVYCSLFIAWYLQKRAFSWSGRSVLLVPFCQLLCFCYATLCSLSRITDHRHHWWDVAVGAGIGVMTYLLAAIGAFDHFSASTKKSNSSKGP